jgi:hypothetical protein
VSRSPRCGRGHRLGSTAPARPGETCLTNWRGKAPTAGSATGVWTTLGKQLLTGGQADADADAARELDWLAHTVDSTVARPPARRRAQPGKTPHSEPADHSLGRSRGGLSTKTHRSAESRCRPMSMLFTAGQAGDAPQLEAVMDAITVPRQRPWPTPPQTTRGPCRHGLLVARDPRMAAPRWHPRRDPATGRPENATAAPWEPVPLLTCQGLGGLAADLARSLAQAADHPRRCSLR